MFKSHDFQTALLSWYDIHARDLPWRSKSGQKADPYHVWLSEIMLQQTTVPAVIPYFNKFINLWPTLGDFAAANPDDVMREWAGLGYYARARNLLKCAQVVVSDYGGIFPDTVESLSKLPGIGPYTSAAIAAIAFNRHAVVVDGNIERVTARIFAVTEPMPKVKPVLRQEAAKLFGGTDRPGDLAQALMDHGSSICIPKNPRCMICPVREFCTAYKLGIQNELPKKAAKGERPKREGRVYWLTNEKGEVLLERRDDKRMLGGMMGLPTTDWDKKSPAGPEIANAVYVTDVYHSFTHFDLKLEVWKADIRSQDFSAGLWYKGKDITRAGLPGVFTKVAKVFAE